MFNFQINASGMIGGDECKVNKNKKGLFTVI